MSPVGVGVGQHRALRLSVLFYFTLIQINE